MAYVKIPVSAEFDSGDIEKAVRQFSGQMDRLARSVAKANNTKFEPIDSATVDDVNTVIRQFEALKRVSGGFSKRLKETGQDKLGLFDVDFHRLYENKRAGARKALDVLQYVTAGTTIAPRMPKPEDTAGQKRDESLPFAGGPGTNGWKYWGGNIFHSAMNAAGPGGQVVGNAVNIGMLGGLKAGLMGLVGGAAALGISKLVGSAKDKADEVGQEYIGYDHLKRSLGDVNVGFGMLKDSLRMASEEIAETYAEGQKLGIEFARIAGLSRDQAQNLAKEVAIGGGFSWSMGMDKYQGNRFFAQMRQFGVTGNDSDTRRFALLLGEGIARSGAFSKADEMMQAIAGYTSSQARMSLTAPNVEAYTGMLAGMVQSKTPGLDPQGSAQLLARVNAAIAAGGGAGEAGQHFIYRALGREQGIADPVMVRILQEGAMFGTPANTFGSESWNTFARRGNIETPQFANPDVTNFEAIMSALDTSYGNRPLLKLDAMTRLFQVNYAQAMALSNIHAQNPEALGGMEDRLKKLNLDIKDVSGTAIPMLANIHMGGVDELRKVTSDLWGRTGKDALSKDERNRLSAATQDANTNGDLEPLRDALFKIAVTRGMQETEGSKTQSLISETNRRLSDLSTPLLSATNDIRTGILYLAKEAGLEPKVLYKKAIDDAYRDFDAAGEIKINGSTEGPPELVDPARRPKPLTRFSNSWYPGEEPVDQLPDESHEFQRFGQEMPEPSPGASSTVRDYSGLMSQIDGFDIDPGMKENMKKIFAELPEEQARRHLADPFFLAIPAIESSYRHRNPDGTLIKGFEPNARGQYAHGIAQFMPDTAKDMGLDINSEAGAHLNAAHNYLDWLRGRFGGDDVKAVAAYQAGVGTIEGLVEKHGDDWFKYTTTENRAYLPKVLAIADNMWSLRDPYDAASDSMRPLPEGHGRRAGRENEITVNLNDTRNLTLNWPDGKPAMLPISEVNKRVIGRARPFGVD